MKELSIKIDDDLYRRASQKVDNLEAQVSQRVTEYLESVKGDDEVLFAARARLSGLFSMTKNYGVGIRPAREEMHER